MHFNAWRASSPRVKFWMLLDEVAHVVPGLRNHRAAKWICDRFELSLGVLPEELYRS